MKVAEEYVRRKKNVFLSELSGLSRVLSEPCCFRGKRSEYAGVLSWGAETACMYAGKTHPGKTAGRRVTMGDAETMKLHEL